MRNMPLMGFGTYIGQEYPKIPDAAECHKVVKEAIINAFKSGFRHLDLAENYYNLPAVAEALKFAFTPEPQGLGLRREDVWITMKSGPGYNQAHMRNLLQQVGVDHFDLFLIHYPQGSLFSSEDDLQQAWTALHEMVASNLVTHIGVSNFYEGHLSRLIAICARENLTRPYANEVELNAWFKNKDLIDYCKGQDIKLIAYSPLGFANSPAVLAHEPLVALATAIEATPAQAALAWLMSKDIAVIPKSTNPDHIRENFAASRFVSVLNQHGELVQELDESEDLFPSTEMAGSSMSHGQEISWNVAHSSFSP